MASKVRPDGLFGRAEFAETRGGKLRKSKRALANQALNIVALEDTFTRETLDRRPGERAVLHDQEVHELSELRGGGLIRIEGSSLGNDVRQKNVASPLERLADVSQGWRRTGYRVPQRHRRCEGWRGVATYLDRSTSDLSRGGHC